MFLKKQLRIVLKVLFLCIMITSVVAPLYAQVVEKTFEELHDESNDIILAEVHQMSSYWNEEHSKIYTDIDVKIKQSYKGKLKKDDIVKYTYLGGSVDGKMMAVSILPSYQVGEECILFLKKKNQYYSVSGFMQGKFNINKEQSEAKIYREKMPTAIKRKNNGKAIKVDKKDGITLDQFVEIIKSHKK